MGKIDTKFRTESRQCSVGCVKQGVRGYIIRRSEPFALEYAPQCLGYIQMRTIWWLEKEEKTSFFPYGSEFGNEFATMYTCIVQYNKGVFPYAEGKTVKEVCDLIGCDTLGGTEPLISVGSVNHAENVEFVATPGWYNITPLVPPSLHGQDCGSRWLRQDGVTGPVVMLRGRRWCAPLSVYGCRHVQTATGVPSLCAAG